MHSFPKMGLLSLLRLALYLSPIAVNAADVNYKFDIANTQVAPDGFKRTGVLVNGVFPGTLIQAQKDDTLHITVNDQLTDIAMRQSTGIHWHGLFQFKTASEDGPVGVNQCPIAPGHSYTYDSMLITFSSLPERLIDFEYPSTARRAPSGIIVICLRNMSMASVDPEDPHLSLYDVDDANTVITLADWYHKPAPGIEDIYLFEDGGGNHEPIMDSGLINGVGRYIGGSKVTRARVNVVAGKRYRLRVINISAYAGYQFSIEGHSLTIIEVRAL
ncbi:hypothetical protein H0H87_005591 [Tephrocybe sp. NHM501043]|nr:hypothetical protein H0H87_005591 [Tephrocybe sp. NHM501043]